MHQSINRSLAGLHTIACVLWWQVWLEPLFIIIVRPHFRMRLLMRPWEQG